MKITRHHDPERMAISAPMRRRLVTTDSDGSTGGKEQFNHNMLGCSADHSDRYNNTTRWGHTGRKQHKAHRRYRHALNRH